MLYAVDQEGSITARFPLSERLGDWEDLAVSTCAEHGSCLYLADLGDNYEERSAGRIQLHRVLEPDPTGSGGELDAEGRLPSESFPIRLPDGARRTAHPRGVYRRRRRIRLLEADLWSSCGLLIRATQCHDG